MRSTSLLLVCISMLLAMACSQESVTPENKSYEAEEDKLISKMYPSDHFHAQRTQPGETFAFETYEQIVKAVNANLNNRSASFQLNWTLEGPANIGGRINTLAIDPNDQSIIYAGNAAGGVYKTTDFGNTWLPIFDDQVFGAIGDIEIDPTDSDVIYVGTGDPNISGFPHIGDGLYKSTDGGNSWSHLGFLDDRIVSRVEVHPQNPDIIYVATMGLPFIRSSNKGLYKSTDGGGSFSKVFFADDTTGVIDLLIDPTDTNIVYLATWTRVRNNHESVINSESAQVYKSIDGGDNWTQLTNGLPTFSKSRVGLAMFGGNPNTVFTMYVDTFQQLGGIFKSTDAGNTWNPVNTFGLDPSALGGFGWYFGQIRVNPYDEDEMFLLGVELWMTEDGGNNWSVANPPWWTYDVHADKHDLIFLSEDSIIIATDGGLYITYDGTANWTDMEDIPNSQFYHVAINPHNPGFYTGGAQDNGTTTGNSANLLGWTRDYGGDGFNPIFDPVDDQVVWAETQNGGIVVSNNGGASFSNGTAGIDPSDRRNWDMPYIMSEHSNNMLYAGTYRVYRNSTGSSPVWSPISPDLTDGLIFNQRHHNISTLRDAPLNVNMICTGTSDGNVWVTKNFGVQWDNVTSTLPDHYVSDIECSYNDMGIIFVTHSGYKENDFFPHIHMSKDTGNTWIDISGDLPPLSINDMEVTPLNDSLLFVATDGGVYYTLNQGVSWERLGVNMPTWLIYDVEIDLNTNILVAGTFARSIHSIEIDSLIGSYSVTAVASTSVDSICEGESANLLASGGTQYNWTPGAGLSCTQCSNPVASPLTTTEYIVEVSNGTVSDFDTVTVYVKISPSDPIASGSGTDLVVSVNNGDTYQWYLGGTPIPGAEDTIYSPTESGNYMVQVTSVDGCSKFSNTVVYENVSISPIDNESITMYPNPAMDRLFIESEDEFLGRVMTIGGKTIMLFQTFSNEVTTLNTQDLSSGLYVVELRKNGEVKRGMVVKW